MNTSNCQPEVKTLNYLKKNLLYCFEPQTRSQLKEQIENLEDNFFTAPSAATADTSSKTPEESKSAAARKPRRPKVGDEVKEEGEEEGDDRKQRREQ